MDTRTDRALPLAMTMRRHTTVVDAAGAVAICGRATVARAATIVDKDTVDDSSVAAIEVARPVVILSVGIWDRVLAPPVTRVTSDDFSAAAVAGKLVDSVAVRAATPAISLT